MRCAHGTTTCECVCVCVRVLGARFSFCHCRLSSASLTVCILFRFNCVWVTTTKIKMIRGAIAILLHFEIIVFNSLVRNLPFYLFLVCLRDPFVIRNSSVCSVRMWTEREKLAEIFCVHNVNATGGCAIHSNLNRMYTKPKKFHVQIVEQLGKQMTSWSFVVRHRRYDRFSFSHISQNIHKYCIDIRQPAR